MGNCCSDSRSAVGGGASYHNSHSDPPDDSVDDGFRLRGYPGLVSQIELSFSASNLTDRDATSKEPQKIVIEFIMKFPARNVIHSILAVVAFSLPNSDCQSDPVLVVFSKGRDGALKELGRTDIIIDSPNPKWTSTLTMIYHFEVVQMLMFRVYDVASVFHNADVKMLKLDEQLYLGEATCALAEIVNKSDRSLTLDLVHVEEPMRSRDSVYCGKLIIHAEECVSSKTTVELMLRCTDLEHKDLFSRSDPFLIISKFVDSKIPIALCKTEVIKNDQSPSWKSVYLTIQQVGSKDSPLLIECFNFNSNGKNDLIGKVQLSIAELEKLFISGQGANLFLPDAVGHDYDGKIIKSQLFVDKLSEGIQQTFLDYLVKGCEMNFMVAVDFTASNGNPRLPDSLHFIDPSGRPNAYQKAILEVGEVLQFYNSRKRFPAWGFGARPIDGPVSHCFNLNGSNHQCEVEGIQGIMMAYASALLNVSLAGPTLFGPVISNAAQIASQSLAHDRPKYFILLIITDGVVTDLQETKDAIVKASDLPLSILIFGVGGADFKEMEVFDADKGEALVNSMGCVASRNIVQFIPFQNLQSGETSPIVQVLLAELPARFLSYLRSRNIQPN